MCIRDRLTHLDKVAGFFATLNLPAPGATAMMVGSFELIGGALFFAGIVSRLVSLVLFVNMTCLLYTSTSLNPLPPPHEGSDAL